MHDRQHAGKRQPAGHADHVLLGDAAFEEALREPLGEGDQPHVLDEVGVERDQVRPPRRRRKQRLGIGREQRLGLCGGGGSMRRG